MPAPSRPAPHHVTASSASAFGQHVVLRLDGDAPIVTTVAQRRVASTVLLAVPEPFGLLAFGFADTHAHCVLAAEREAVGEAIRRAELSLGRRLGLRARFEPARIRPITDLWHLYRTFWYVLKQSERHAPGADPNHEGSALPDLVGARCVAPSLRGRVFAALPRLDRRELEAMFLGTSEAGSSRDLEKLEEAAAAGFGIGSVSGRSHEACRARRAAIHAASGLSGRELARLLGVSVDCVEAIRREPPDPPAVRAVQLQLQRRSRAPGDETRPDAAPPLRSSPRERPASGP
jgi:hypothetical protein